MPVSMVGVQFKRLMSDRDVWSREIGYEGAVVTVDGDPSKYDLDPDAVPDGAVVVIQGGTTFAGSSLESVAHAWLPANAMVAVHMELPLEKWSQIKALLSGNAWRVVSG